MRQITKRIVVGIIAWPITMPIGILYIAVVTVVFLASVANYVVRGKWNFNPKL